MTVMVVGALVLGGVVAARSITASSPSSLWSIGVDGSHPAPSSRGRGWGVAVAVIHRDPHIQQPPA
jgi:hypothetical protein